jgi:hypothetical protein
LLGKIVRHHNAAHSAVVFVGIINVTSDKRQRDGRAAIITRIIDAAKKIRRFLKE